MARSEPQPPAVRDPVEEMAEDFLERYRRGERPPLTEFTARAPEHADEIRELFPALVLMEQAGAPVSAPGVRSLPVVPLERLGEYRIIREVGRGGMGVVYEAEQEALGRHVALKVLPRATAGDSSCLLRFRREARSAARLHHTNIVPVFDIGERDGVHFYAMQFIQGQGLDEVITELQRLRGSSRAPAAAPPSLRVAAHLAGSLLTGQFAADEQATDRVSASAARPGVAADGSAAHAPRRGADQESGGTSALLSDRSDFSTKSDVQFYRSVARIGVQVADALAYAHGQKLLHRDIKPSNLLLDARGTVWVTDFGLAKEEGDDLTRTGDVVGTLRYMAPERFAGVSDARSDLYSLGLTLYEMLTLRPAFPETDRARLIQAITHQEPKAPRKLDPHTPRDLETIVLKAISKDPAGRYATAEDLGEDLRRFLADRPIQARRTSTWERMRRWCRRNPGWAATLATVLGLLVVMALGGMIFSLKLGRALDDVRVADAEKTEQLWQAHLLRARALRTSGRVGQRFEALKAIRAAAEIKASPELRDEAVAALVLPDVEVEREWQGYPEDTLFWAHDAAFERYARINKKGEVTVCRPGQEGEEIIVRLPAFGTPRFWGLWVSPGGRYVVYGHSSQFEGTAAAIRIWKVDGVTPLSWDLPASLRLNALSFHADGRRLAIGQSDGTIDVHDLETKQLLKRLKIDQAPNNLTFHPQDDRLAVACNHSVRVLDVGTGREVWRPRDAKTNKDSFGLAWHPHGRILAAASDDRKIHLWDTETGARVMPPLEGHTADGIFMAFNHRGDRLISSGWDRTSKLWDTVSGRLLLSIPGRLGTVFSRDDARIGIEQEGTKLRIWRLADGRELRAIRRPTRDREETVGYAVLAAEDRIVVAGSNRGLVFFELETGRELGFVRFNNDNMMPTSVNEADGLLTAGNGATFAWPIRRDPHRADLVHIGPPRHLAPTVAYMIGVSRDGRIRAFPQGHQTLVLDRDRPGLRVELGPQDDVRQSSVSPDGDWVATCSWFWDGRSKSVRIWDARSGNHVLDLPLEGSSTASFSPGGRWLATSTTWVGISALRHGCQLWEVGSWRPVRQFKDVAWWSPDGRLLGGANAVSEIRLVEPESGKAVFCLTGPEATWFHPQCLTRDGTRLIAWASDARALWVWDLRLIRAGLRDLGMDWDWPEFEPAPPPEKAPGPLTLKVDPGIMRQPLFDNDRQAVAVYSLAATLQPINPEASLQRGLAYRRLRDWAQAVADYEGFLALTTDDVDSRRPEIRRQYAELCNHLAWNGVKSPPTGSLPPVMLSWAEKAVAAAPAEFLYRNTLGVALYRAGRYDEAIRCLEPNVEPSRQYAAFDLYFLAMSHQRLGRLDAARTCFERANAAVAEAHLSAAHQQELAAFRAEAEQVLKSSARRDRTFYRPEPRNR